MMTPTIAQKSPFGVDVEAGRTYWWCACGESKRQPFCDGSHKGGSFVPLEFTAPGNENALVLRLQTHEKSAPL